MTVLQVVWPAGDRTEPPRPPWNVHKVTISPTTSRAHVDDTPLAAPGRAMPLPAAPAAPLSALVYADGTVERAATPTPQQVADAQHVLQGGRVYTVTEGSFLHQALANAGFTFVPEEAT